MILLGDLHRLPAETCPNRVAAEVGQEVIRHAVPAEALTISLVSRPSLREDHLQTTQAAELYHSSQVGLEGLRRTLEKRAGRRVVVDPDTPLMMKEIQLCFRSLVIEGRQTIAASIRVFKRRRPDLRKPIAKVQARRVFHLMTGLDAILKQEVQRILHLQDLRSSHWQTGLPELKMNPLWSTSRMSSMNTMIPRNTFPMVS